VERGRLRPSGETDTGSATLISEDSTKSTALPLKYRQVSADGMYVQNHRLFGVCPPSDILKTRKHSVSETGFVFVHS
jgi:hypothetical protein